MCKRQINKRPAVPKPSNDNVPRPAARFTDERQISLKSGILPAVLERTDRVRLDFVADGVLRIQGQSQRRGESGYEWSRIQTMKGFQEIWLS